MIYLQTYRMFESQQNGLTPEQKEMLDDYCKTYRHDGGEADPKKLWWVGEDGLVNVEGDFMANPTNHKYKGWTGLLGVKFGRVKGNFKVPGIGIESASDFPRSVGGRLSAEDNKLRTVEGIGLVEGSSSVQGPINLERNLLVSLEGITEDHENSSDPYLIFDGLSGNPVRAGFLTDDLQEVLTGKRTWGEIYLDIVTGEYVLNPSRDPEGTIIWILENKLGPEVLGTLIRKDPEKMAVELAKIPSKYRKYLTPTLDKMDLPPGFREDKDLLSSLGDVGL